MVQKINKGKDKRKFTSDKFEKSKRKFEGKKQKKSRDEDVNWVVEIPHLSRWMEREEF